jgi:DNA anti-recombination protein RmuC
VLHGLKGLQVEERARELQAELATLGREFARFRIAFEKVGTHLGNAQRQYAESERAAERVWTRVERLGTGAVSPDEAVLPAPVEESRVSA